MFGDSSDGGRRPIRVCCGPRCGAEPGHRAVYSAVEAAAEAREMAVLPTMCQGLCGAGVTVVLSADDKRKVREAGEAVGIFDAVPASC